MHLKNCSLTLFRLLIKDNQLKIYSSAPIEAKPCHIYSFSENKSEEVGGIWFVAFLDGYKKTELGMFHWNMKGPPFQPGRRRVQFFGQHSLNTVEKSGHKTQFD